jgi:uncharacterized protein
MKKSQNLSDAISAIGNHKYQYAFEILMPLAQDSEPLAQYHIGTFFDDGLLVAEDPLRAIYWYEKSAVNGCAYADAALGHLLSPEIDGPSDKERSDAFIYKAVEEFSHDKYQHDAEAHFWLGYFYFLNSGGKEELAKASAHFLIGAKAGHTKCMASFSLADIFLSHETGGSKDPQQSLKWAEKAVELGSPLASEMLANFYAKGGILGSNAEKEFHYRLLAAKGGVVSEMLEVGKSYEFGCGTEISIHKAVKWYLKASRSNLPEAQYFAATLDERNEEIRINEKRKLTLLWQSAAKKFPPALYRLSREYRHLTTLTPYIEDEANDLLREAAELGDVRAMHEYGNRLAFESGEQQQQETGFEFLCKAVEGENFYAYVDLAHCYAFGLGVERSLSGAVRCHEEALKNGVFKSAAYLGFLYSDPEYRGYDPSKALAYRLFAYDRLDEADFKSDVENAISTAKHSLPKIQLDQAFAFSTMLEAHFSN